MLQVPDVGLRQSIKEHNSDFDVLCDWIEASVLLVDDTLSAIDVVDVLMEEQLYREQDFAHEIVEQAWSAIDRRQKWLNASRTIRVEGPRLIRELDMAQVPAHTFCLVVALRRCLKSWSRELGPNYVEQGHLFEMITEESLKVQGWEVYRTGWAGIAAPLSFGEVVGKIADNLNEPAIEGIVLPEQANDQGLDLLCTWPFRDRRGGYVVYLVQCASGDNWERKLRTPSLELWRELIRFSSPHRRGIAVPFAFPDDGAFRVKRLSAEGLFLDRYRILGAGFQKAGWESDGLRRDLMMWLEPKVALLLTSVH